MYVHIIMFIFIIFSLGMKKTASGSWTKHKHIRWDVAYSPNKLIYTNTYHQTRHKFLFSYMFLNVFV